MVLLCLVWGIGLVLTDAARQIRDLSQDSMQRTQAGKEIAAAAGALELAVTRFSKKEAPPRADELDFAEAAPPARTRTFWRLPSPGAARGPGGSAARA